MPEDLTRLIACVWLAAPPAERTPFFEFGSAKVRGVRLARLDRAELVAMLPPAERPQFERTKARPKARPASTASGPSAGVRALSVRQPWAELIARGTKSIEVRTWVTSYRGPLAIVASRACDATLCRDLGLDLTTLARGALVCLVDLVDCRRMRGRADRIAAGLELYLDACEVPERDRSLPSDADPDGDDDFAWVLSNPRRLEPHAVRGRLSLFSVPVPLVHEVLAVPA
jgi:hypothetical protein